MQLIIPFTFLSVPMLSKSNDLSFIACLPRKVFLNSFFSMTQTNGQCIDGGDCCALVFFVKAFLLGGSCRLAFFFFFFYLYHYVCWFAFFCGSLRAIIRQFPTYSFLHCFYSIQLLEFCLLLLCQLLLRLLFLSLESSSLSPFLHF